MNQDHFDAERPAEVAPATGPTSRTADVVSRLPQLDGRPFVTDGGMETDFIFHHGVDLPCFAAFPLLEHRDGRALLSVYYDGYAEVARRAGAGLMLESPTWRANTDWGGQLGYSADGLRRINHQSISLLRQLRDGYTASGLEVVVGGMVGPRGDGYRPSCVTSPDEAAVYHHPQLAALADAGADLATAYTLTDVNEALGIVRAAHDVGLSIAISFTVETDGRLASDKTLAEAITEVDDAGGPEYFLVNCAHPEHMAGAVREPGSWRERIIGVRHNASTLSHEQLDDAAELDEGDPAALAAAHGELARELPNLTILGGCCGTDARHVATLWETCPPSSVGAGRPRVGSARARGG